MRTPTRARARSTPTHARTRAHTARPLTCTSPHTQVFEVQAWVALVAGGLLSFNVIFPTDDPSIPRLMGMWSIWMFTVPSLRAKECMPRCARVATSGCVGRMRDG